MTTLTSHMTPIDLGGAVIDATGITLAAGRWYNVKNATILNLTTTGGFSCFTCSNLKFVGLKAEAGVTFVGGNNFTIHRGDLSGAGVYAQRLDGLTITETLFYHPTVGDFVDIPGCDNVVIEWNAFFRDRPAPVGSHPDAIQSFAVPGFHPKSVRIAHNFILGASQGIFGVGADNLVIERNLIMVDFQNAIYPDQNYPPAMIDTNTVASREGGFAQATIIAKSFFKGENKIGAWGTKSAKVIEPTASAVPTPAPAPAPAPTPTPQPVPAPQPNPNVQS